MKPFGTYQPDSATQRKIDWCHRLPANWLGKQIAQLLRKQVLSKAQMPLDLTFDQVRLRCHLTDNVSERGFVFMPWRWDAVEREVMLKALPPEGVFVDIGANVGIYSAIAATAINRLGAVIALEPNPVAFERLSFNLSATREGRREKPRIEMIPMGISDVEETLDLYLDADNLGASSLLEKPSQEKNKTHTVPIPCEPLLQVIERQKLSRVDVIKCDIEGAEDRALIPYLMDAPHHLLPHCFIFENNQDQWQGDLLEVLKQRDYHQTHQTRLNYIYQLRQPIHFTSKAKRARNHVPVIG
ncbi:FkbM family methyltransferase [Marinicella sp. S1101]|uniref:FkbM family methyltransferase n=1 Tax=Marinicella marina TaxID=2996016 RepID=UPI002260B7B4|nr:FkbM family methyltransferase [Marinicella marina]MCX7553132.1 FkbM family methyltransferase [Marinicella marina]MDJ1138864.1 FkbM family methyltransferase [Marinicella marina]